MADDKDGGGTMECHWIGTSGFLGPKYSIVSVLQHILSAVACLPLLSSGISIGYPATTLLQLRPTSSNTTFTLDVDQESWSTSMLAATAPLGGFIAITLLDRLGRRTLLLASNVPALLGWLLVSRAPHTSSPTNELYAARGLAGVSLGVAMTSCTVYLAEVITLRSSHPLTSWPGLVLSLGVFVAYVLGTLLHWTIVAWVATAVPCLAVLAVVWALPESPAWLRLQGRSGDADWALQRLRLPYPPSSPSLPCPGCSTDSKKHDNCLFCADRFQDPSTSQVNDASDNDDACKTMLQVLFTKEVMKNLFVQVLLVFFQQFSGIFAILAYLVDVIDGLNVTELGPYNVAMLCGALLFLSNMCFSILEPKLGIRNIIIFCSAGMAFSMLFLSFHLALLHVGGAMAVLYYKWIPFAAILFFVFFGGAWVAVFPWLELGEKFPPRVKGTIGYILFLFTFAFYFVNLKFFPPTTAYFRFEMTEVWYYLCLISTVGTVFMFFFWPKSQYTLVGVMGGTVVTPMYTVLPEEERLLSTDDVLRT
ncbi:hypothetical protein PR048_003633 [Dryococelus australis]|uniref:Major facilitator superfamily (MFS) profile domain-containing protein n=1 Tax=Dryococelus australis TaxID=614101 RepID=A0ABQ9INM9_9NEOP|nr:hypothetical protein PR048_003633 [Dryococelus australis]